jgi:hypothetical protein
MATMAGSRRRMMLLGLVSTVAAAVRAGAPAPIKDNPGEQIPGPSQPADPANVAAWRASLTDWRARMLKKIDYNGSIYGTSLLLLSASCER